jgi:hypothetical protein
LSNKVSPRTEDISAFFSDVVTLAFWGVGIFDKKKLRITKDKNKSPK